MSFFGEFVFTFSEKHDKLNIVYASFGDIEPKRTCNIGYDERHGK